MSENSYSIPTWKVEAVSKKIEALNRRADKLGLPRATFEIGESRTEPHDAHCGCCAGLRSDRFTEVIAHSDHIRIDGWALVGVLDFTVGDKPIVKHVADQEPPSRYREAAPTCEHCRQIRSRKAVFVLEKDGNHKQVGSTCLGDYLGENTAQAIASYAAWVDSLEKALEEAESSNGGGSAEAMWNLDGFLAYTGAEIDKNGWVSRTKAQEEEGLLSTADAVLSLLFQSKRPKKVEEFRAEAEVAIDWARKVEPSNDYLHNIRVLAEAGITNHKNAGFAASILTSYRRAEERRIKAEADAKIADKAGHFGEPGKRVKGVRVMLLSIHRIDGNYGPTDIHKFRTIDGHALTWFASADSGMGRGKRYKVDFTVKKHSDFQGVPETLVNRVKQVTP